MEWQSIIIAVLGSSALATLISNLFTVALKKHEQDSGINKGVRLILKDRCRYLAGQYIHQGWLYADELEDLLALWTTYKDMGGNGYLTNLMDRVQKLDIRGIDHH